MRSRSKFTRGEPIVAVAVTVFLLVLAWLPLIPPVAGRGEFSSKRALSDVELLATEPHPIGSTAIEVVRLSIIARIRELGLEPVAQSLEVPDYYGIAAGMVPVVNVMARIPGTSSTGSVALMAHYDTAPSTPGGNDNTAGVAVLLEAARLVLAGPPLRNDVILLFTDGEEPAPRYGSTAFVTGHPWASEIGVVVNLEAVGGAGPSTLLAVTGPRPWLMEQYAAAAPRPVAYSFLTDVVDLIGGSNTDIAPFRDAGIAGLEMAYLHGSPIYHTSADTPAAVGIRSLDHQGRNALAVVRRLAGLDLTKTRAMADTVFFTVGRETVVRHPAAWIVPVVVVGAIVLGFASWNRWRRGATSLRDVLRAVVSTGLIVVASALLAMVAWSAVTSVVEMPGLVESYVYLAGVLVLVVAVAAGAGRLAQRRLVPAFDPVGVSIVWLSLAALTSMRPGVGYLFAWPAVAAALSLAGPRGLVGSAARWKRMSGFILVAGPMLLLLVPAIDVFYQFTQPRPGNPDSELMWVIAVPAVLMALAAVTLRAVWPGMIAVKHSEPRSINA